MAWLPSCFGARKDNHIGRHKRFSSRFRRIFGAAKRALSRREVKQQSEANVPSFGPQHENVNVNLLGPHYASSAETSPLASAAPTFVQELRDTQCLQSPMRCSIPTYIDTSDTSGCISLSSPSSPATPKQVVCSTPPKSSNEPTVDYLTIDEGFAPLPFKGVKENIYDGKGVRDSVASKDLVIFTPLHVQNLPDMKPSKEDETVKLAERETRLGSFSSSPKRSQLDGIEPRKRSHSFSPDDMPILGIVAAHWQDRSPKTWDGKGIPNLTTKYNEDQAIKWENTPFEAKLERALAIHT